MTELSKSRDEGSDDWTAALKAYTKRLEQKPKDCATLCNRAFVLVRLERFEEALRDAELCVEIEDSFARGHTRIAQATEKRDRKRSIRACHRALQLDPEDAAAARLLVKVDLNLAAGLQVKKALAETAEDRRDGVKAMLPESRTFAKKWAKIDTDHRRKLILRMLARAFNEVKGAFMEAFEPAQGNLAPDEPERADLSMKKVMQELLAVNVLLCSDLLTEEILQDAKDGKPATRDVSKIDDDDSDDESTELPMLRFIKHAAAGRESSEKCMGWQLREMMNAYEFEPFEGHPRARDFSLGLIEAQRATICLVVCHMLLGGDGLPTLAASCRASMAEEGFRDEVAAEVSPVSERSPAPPQKKKGSKTAQVSVRNAMAAFDEIKANRRSVDAMAAFDEIKANRRSVDEDSAATPQTAATGATAAVPAHASPAQRTPAVDEAEREKENKKVVSPDGPSEAWGGGDDIDGDIDGEALEASLAAEDAAMDELERSMGCDEEDFDDEDELQRMMLAGEASAEDLEEYKRFLGAELGVHAEADEADEDYEADGDDFEADDAEPDPHGRRPVGPPRKEDKLEAEDV